jgi:hypothetical protein
MATTRMGWAGVWVIQSAGGGTGINAKHIVCHKDTKEIKSFIIRIMNFLVSLWQVYLPYQSNIPFFQDIIAVQILGFDVINKGAYIL